MADDPIPEDLRGVMRNVGNLIGDAINKHSDRPMGFMLMTFDIGTGGRTSYISNVERESVIEAMKEFLERQDGDTG